MATRNQVFGAITLLIGSVFSMIDIGFDVALALFYNYHARKGYYSLDRTKLLSRKLTNCFDQNKLYRVKTIYTSKFGFVLCNSILP